MPASMTLLFFLSTLACFTLFVAGVQYYLRTRNDPLARRIEDLQEQSMGASSGPRTSGDVWDLLLESTYGLVFGRTWFRQKETELMRAGIRGPYAVKLYGVVSLFLTVLLVFAAYWYLKNGDVATLLFGLAGALALGYFLPEQVVTSLRNRHRLSLMAALPDTTDILSIVLGAGLSLDQAIARVSEEIRFVYPELADEFYWMTLEVQAGQDRAVAFQHMAQRTGLLDIRSLASMIVQAERFGTGLSQALRIYADYLRTKRRLMMEEKINKVPIKMLFPIVLCILLPFIFIEIIGPGFLMILRDLQSLR
ncbi:MAG: type II secretion system F family protein [Acidobacteria bacterium]|nr:type II secretion system F family protein [Acidobacteriota bacterium]